MNELLAFLSKFKELTSDQVRELAQLMKVRTVLKNGVVVKEGDVCNECFFVLRGCLRQYGQRWSREDDVSLYAGSRPSTTLPTRRVKRSLTISWWHWKRVCCWSAILQKTLVSTSSFRCWPASPVECWKKILERLRTLSPHLSRSARAALCASSKERPDPPRAACTQIVLASFLGITPGIAEQNPEATAGEIDAQEGALVFSLPPFNSFQRIGHFTENHGRDEDRIHQL